MNKDYPLTDLQSKINANQKIIVYLPANPNLDQVAAALSLYLSLEKSGKTATVVCSSQMIVEFNRLIGVDRIVNKLKGTDLIVSLNYPAEQIEKVSYNDDQGRPNVVIQPKTGAPPITENLVTFSYAGLSSGLVITCGLKNLNGFSEKDREIMSSAEIINLDINQDNEGFGLLNVVDVNSSSVSEVVLGIIIGLSLPFGQDIAQNVLSGILQNTNGMAKPGIGADAYEAVAICLRAGAQRQTEEFVSQQDNLKPKAKFEPREERKPAQSPAKPPADWFEPKIFKGSSIA